MPLSAQALVDVVDLVRGLEVDGVDLEAGGPSRCDNVVARVEVTQLEVVPDRGTLAASIRA